MTWPHDADGDVMRRLQADGFDFAREAEIDFNIDFEDWPPSDAAISAVQAAFPTARVHTPGDYIQLQLVARITYPFVMDMQDRLTRLTTQWGGRCDSWGVLWDPRKG